MKNPKIKTDGARYFALDDLTSRSYAVNPTTLDEQSRSFEATIASEMPVVAFDWKRGLVNEVLLMSGLRMPANGQVPLLDSHGRGSVTTILGSCRNLRVEGDKLVGRNFLSRKAAAVEAFEMVKEGHLTDNSVGYRVLKFDTVEPGKSAQVAGRNFTANADMALRVVTDWQVYENSICAIGADVSAKVRSASAEPHNHKPTFVKEYHTMAFKEWLQKRGFELDSLSESQAASLRDIYDAEQKQAAVDAARANAQTVDKDALLEQGRQAELRRQEEIRKIAGNISPELVERAIRENWSLETAKDKFLEAFRSGFTGIVNGAPAIHVRDTEVNGRALEAALLMRGGFEKAVTDDKTIDGKTVDQAERLRDMNLVDVCREAVRLDNKVIPVGRMDMIRTAFSSATLPKILGAVANKAMLQGYNALPATWEKWCSVGSVSDFKTQTRVRLTDVGELEQVGNSGEIKHGSASEEYETFNIATYAKQFAISRTNIINDDLSAFTSVPQKMGVKANQRISKLVYTHLLANGAMADGVALFYATTHVNLNTSSALSAATIGTAVKAMRIQKDSDGENLSIVPRYLLVPASLEKTAKEILESDLLITTALGSTSSAAVSPNRNIYRGTLDLIVEPRLENSAYSGYSATSWYLIADPATIDTVEVAFLNGKRTPTVERFDADPDTMGIVYRVYIDCGVKALDFRGMVKSTA